MGEKFFTSKEAAKTVGCSLRQLQYWREKGIVIPTIGGTGTGKSIYYSQSDVVRLAIMEYLLSVGLSFATAAWGLKTLVKADNDYANFKNQKRWMLRWDMDMQSLVLEEFDRKEAIAILDRGQAVIPILLKRIYLKIRRESNKLD